MTYSESGGFIFRERTWASGKVDRDLLCTVGEAAAAWVHMMNGPEICKAEGHDYCLRVLSTSNMYTCFRCGEPGWKVPYLDEAQSTEGEK